MKDSPYLITDPSEAAPLVARLQHEGLAALDTEFVWTQTYYPRLGVVQLGAADGSAWALDATAGGAALAKLIADPETVKILHDARQDLTLLAAATGALPRNVFDTQLAAGFAGFAPTISLKQLLHDLLSVDLAKTETRTDWCRRPLTSAQLEYALNDVRYAAALRQALIERATERGAEAWLAEEMQIYDDASLYAPPDPAAAGDRIRGGDRLSGREPMRLRLLATMREHLAQEWDLPRSWVVEDGSLLEAARHGLGAAGAPPIRHRLSRSRLETLRQTMHDVIEAADAAAPPAAPARRERIDAVAKNRTDEALAFLRRRAESLRLAPELYGCRVQVAAFVANLGDPSHPLARGWRYATAGRDLAARFTADLLL